MDEAAGEYAHPLYRDGVREGHTLRTILSRGHLPVSDALGYAEQLLGALQYSHSMGIIHRDISRRTSWCWTAPARISRRVSRARLRSWTSGISRAIEEAGEALTKANVVMGSARYMSPSRSAARRSTPVATCTRPPA